MVVRVCYGGDGCWKRLKVKIEAWWRLLNEVEMKKLKVFEVSILSFVKNWRGTRSVMVNGIYRLRIRLGNAKLVGLSCCYSFFFFRSFRLCRLFRWFAFWSLLRCCVWYRLGVLACYACWLFLFNHCRFFVSIAMRFVSQLSFWIKLFTRWPVWVCLAALLLPFGSSCSWCSLSPFREQLKRACCFHLCIVDSHGLA